MTFQEFKPRKDLIQDLIVADYCPRCRHLFQQGSAIRLVAVGSTARVMHEDCTTREDDVLLKGQFLYTEFTEPTKPTTRR